VLHVVYFEPPKIIKLSRMIISRTFQDKLILQNFSGSEESKKQSRIFQEVW